eukprot:3334106-Amphidinium_carterae.1
MTDRTCEILVGTRIVKETTSRPVSDKLAEAMTKKERRQILEEVRTVYGLRAAPRLWEQSRDA